MQNSVQIYKLLAFLFSSFPQKKLKTWGSCVGISEIRSSKISINVLKAGSVVVGDTGGHCSSKRRSNLVDSVAQMIVNGSDAGEIELCRWDCAR